MTDDACPVPTKKLRVLSDMDDSSVVTKLKIFSDGSDTEDLKLSKTFDENYELLMNEEILKICEEQSHSSRSFYEDCTLPDFIRRIESLSRCGTIKRQSLCRSDRNLENVLYKRHFLEQPQFVNVKTVAKILITHQPHLEKRVKEKLEELNEKLENLISDINVDEIMKDISDDIRDLQIWLENMQKDIQYGVTYENRVQYGEKIETILNDFNIHNKISSSVIKIIDVLISFATAEYQEPLEYLKMQITNVQYFMQQNWLKAMELKIETGIRKSGTFLIGHESGFESELSPEYLTRRINLMNTMNKKTYISSLDSLGEECTTDLPADTESLNLSIGKEHNDYIVLSSSSSSELMTEPSNFQSTKEGCVFLNRRIRRRKRRIARISTHSSPESDDDFQGSQNFLSKVNLKRRFSHVNPKCVADSLAHLNYSDIADEAERLIRKNSVNKDWSSIESAKESEFEDAIDFRNKTMDFDKQWDYYQAPMYSTSDGDSQVIEIDKIKDWDQENDVDPLDLILPTEDFSQKNKDISILLTSGYETSFESDPSQCTKSIVKILQFSTREEVELKRQISEINELIERCNSYDIKNIITVIKEKLSIAYTHSKLINQILSNDTCINVQNHNLIEDLRHLSDCWESLIRKSIVMQSRVEKLYHRNEMDLLVEELTRIEKSIPNISNYSSLPNLLEITDVLKHLQFNTEQALMKFMKIKVSTNFGNVQEKICNIKNQIIDGLKSLKIDQKIIKSSFDLLRLSETIRRSIDSKVNCFSDGKAEIFVLELTNSFEKLQNAFNELSNCIEVVSSLHSERYVKSISAELSCERTHVKNLMDILGSQIKIETLGKDIVIHHEESQTFLRLLRKIPLRFAICLILVLIGWCYKQFVRCTRSSSIVKLCYQTTEKMEPH